MHEGREVSDRLVEFTGSGSWSHALVHLGANRLSRSRSVVPSVSTSSTEIRRSFSLGLVGMIVSRPLAAAGIGRHARRN